MGQLVDGKWEADWDERPSKEGKFVRANSQFRNWVTADGAPGPSGEGGFKAEPGRYHLFVSYACPWAHRALIFRELKGLQDMIGVSVVAARMNNSGWEFDASDDDVVGNKLFQSDYMYEVYQKADPQYTGRVTVPVLWDREQETVVSNESSEIIRMMNSAFDGVGATLADYYPEHLRAEIDPLNERIYETVNNGVYRSGFAVSQEAYETAAQALFETLDVLEERLSSQRFLVGATPTEADWRLFPTLLRFDPVYHGHFKCNLRRIVDYENLWGYTRDLFQWPGIAPTCNLTHIKQHYYSSHVKVNPTGIVPIGPDIDFDAPHTRGGMGVS